MLLMCIQLDSFAIVQDGENYYKEYSNEYTGEGEILCEIPAIDDGVETLDNLFERLPVFITIEEMFDIAIKCKLATINDIKEWIVNGNCE